MIQLSERNALRFYCWSPA